MIDSTLESLVFSRVKNGATKVLKTKYPDINFTNSNKKSKSQKYPYVYIHMMESSEGGSDLESEDVNALLASFEIQIFDDQSQNRTKTVSDAVLAEMKKMHFRAIGFPYNSNTDSLYRVLIRCRRMVGEDDTL